MSQTVKIHFNKEQEYISYIKNDLIISAILSSYDDIDSIVDFDKGLLTVLMRRDGELIEEYVDFCFSLACIYLSGQKKLYFDGVTKNDLVLVKDVDSGKNKDQEFSAPVG